MSPAHVLEPTYHALRRRLVSGAWPSGFHLEAAKLATDLSVSITPVRDSLNRLSGERLVTTRPGAGFQVPVIDEAAFLALVSWHHTLAQLAIAAVSLPVLSIESPQNREGEADAAAILFASITARSGDPELDWALGNAAARLGPFRRWESVILPRAAQELRTLRTAVGGRDRGKVSDLIAKYHDRRRKFARQLVEAATSGHA